MREICEIKTGDAISKINIQNNIGIYPVINSGKEPLGFINRYNVENDPIGVTSRGANVGYITWHEGKYFRGPLNYSVTIKDDGKLTKRFLYFYLLSNQSGIRKLATHHGIPALNASSLSKFKIPIPSMEKQNHIVSILDKFSILTEDISVGLPAEHNARRKQYEHYRGKLLKFKILGGVILIELEMVADILNGYNFKSSTYSNEGIRVIRISDVQKGKISNMKIVYYPSHKKEDYKKQLLKENDLVMSLTGNVGRVAMLSKSNLPAGLNQRVACIRTKTDIVMSRFLYHYFNQDKFERLAIKRSHGAGQKNLSTKWLSKFKIPIPTIDDQKRVVGILDRFDTLINDLSTGLPAEQKARRKQYEYYREKLLTFSL